MVKIKRVRERFPIYQDFKVSQIPQWASKLIEQAIQARNKYHHCLGKIKEKAIIQQAKTIISEKSLEQINENRIQAKKYWIYKYYKQEIPDKNVEFDNGSFELKYIFDDQEKEEIYGDYFKSSGIEGRNFRITRRGQAKTIAVQNQEIGNFEVVDLI